MTLDIACPACRTVLRLPDFLAGTQAQCASCGAAVYVTPPGFQQAATVAGTVAQTVAMPGSFRTGPPAAIVPIEHDPPPGTPLHAEVVAAKGDARKRVGRFVLLAELGAGGMGQVHRAWDGSLRRVVALKTLLPGGEQNAGNVKRFFREAEAVARLRHENIVSVYEAGEIEKHPFIAMEFVQGATLAQYLERSPGKRLPGRAAVELMRDVARALHHAHEQGVIHRDLKPGNIMIDAAGRPRVLDFGLARLSGDRSKLTKSGTTLGTPAYMPPEQTGGDEAKIDKRSDVYSLGATLFHSITGRPPFLGTTEFEIVTAVLTKDAPAASQFESTAHGDLDTICARCLEKDPKDRYATAGELAGELDRWLAGEEIRTQPISAASLIGRRLHRNRGLAIGVGVGACVAFAVAAFVAKLVHDKNVLEAKLQHNADPTPLPEVSASPTTVALAPSPAPTTVAVATPASPAPAPSASPETTTPVVVAPSPAAPTSPSPAPVTPPTAEPSPTPEPSPAPEVTRPAPSPPPAHADVRKNTGWVSKIPNDPRRAPHALDCIATDGKLVYGFGGLATASNQLWSYDPEREEGWKLVHVQGDSPEPRLGAALVWTGENLLLFGGIDAKATPRSDLWKFDPATSKWQNLEPSNKPSPRVGFSACWDGSRLLVHGGITARKSVLDDIYAYEPRENTFVEFPTTGTREAAGNKKGPAFHLARGVLVWNPYESPEKAGNGRGWILGGVVADDSGDNATLVAADVAWKILLSDEKPDKPAKSGKPKHDSNKEKETHCDVRERRPVGEPPEPRLDPCATFDTEHKRMLLFGGLGADGKTAFGDLLAYDSITNNTLRWTVLERAGGDGKPVARVGRLAWVGKRAVLFGGRRGNGEVLNDTWLWEPKS